MNDQRKTIVKRLQRLLSMTLENGASENEALVAAGFSAGNSISLNRGLDDRSLAEIEGGA